MTALQQARCNAFSLVFLVAALVCLMALGWLEAKGG